MLRPYPERCNSARLEVTKRGDTAMAGAERSAMEEHRYDFAVRPRKSEIAVFWTGMTGFK